MNIPSRGSEEERIRIPCGYGLIYRVTDIINKTEIGKYVSVRVRYRVTRHTSAEGGSGEVGARGELGAEGEVGGVPLTITPPLDEHRLDAEESEIRRRVIKPKARARMWRGAPGFLVWNSVTFSGAWLRFSQYSQVFPSIP